MNTSRIISLCMLAGLVVAPLCAMEQEQLSCGESNAAAAAAIVAQAPMEKQTAEQIAERFIDAAQMAARMACQKAEIAVVAAGKFSDSSAQSAQAAEVARKAAEELKDKITEVTQETQKQFSEKTAKLDELFKTQSTRSVELQKALEKAQQTWKTAFVAFGREHQTMLLAGFVGVVAIGGIAYLVHKSGGLTQVARWVGNHKKTLGIAAFGLAVAGLIAANHYGYIDFNGHVDLMRSTQAAAMMSGAQAAMMRLGGFVKTAVTRAHNFYLDIATRGLIARKS